MVFIFRTNIQPSQTPSVKEFLEDLQDIQKVSFDLEDCDKILRVISNFDQIRRIENLLLAKGIFCQELED